MQMGFAKIFVVMVVWVALPYVMRGMGMASLLRGSAHPDFLEVKREGRSGIVDYFVAGILNQPQPAFDFILDSSMLADDTIVLIPYGNGGVNFGHVSDLVIKDAKERGAEKIRIFAISVGCNVSENVSKRFFENEIEFFDINPCWSRRFLKKWLGVVLPILAVLMKIVAAVLGVVGYLPVIPAAGGRFSFYTVADLVWQIAFGHLEPAKVDNRRYRIALLSEKDQFLDNNMLTHYYGYRIILYGVRHADTINDAEYYERAINRCWK